MVNPKKVERVRGHLQYREVSSHRINYSPSGLHIDLQDTMAVLLEVVEENKVLRDRIEVLEKRVDCTVIGIGMCKKEIKRKGEEL